MAEHMNCITIIGNIGADAEQRFTNGGTPVCNVSVACNVGRGDKKKTQLYRVAFFGKRGEQLAPQLTKGKTILVMGDLSIELFDGNNGKQVRAEIVASDIKFIGDPRGAGDGAPAAARKPAYPQDPSDDLPA